MRASSSFGCKRRDIPDRTKKLGLGHLLFLLAVVSSCEGCPDKCLCVTTTVKCQNQALHAIPQHFPVNTKSLFVTGNKISHLSSDSFPTLLARLTDLYLGGNEIESVDPMVFDNLPNLERLDLSNNRLQYFSSRAFPDDNKLQVFNLSRAIQNHYNTDVIGVLQNASLLHLTSVDLSNNDLVVLPDSLFMGLSKLTKLSLQNNSLIMIQNEILKVPPLQDLDLRDNSLRVLPNATLLDFSQKPGLRIRMSENPWRCDCSIEDLVVWLKSTDQVTDMQNLTCVEPESLSHLSLLQVERSQLRCNTSGDMKGVLETSYVFLGLVLALIGVIFLLVLYLNRKGIKRWMYNIRDACRDHMEGYHYRYEINSDPRVANLSINSDV